MSGVRFAPSPTGTFHLGNFRTAYVSWAWSRALGEPWVVRFEDIDGPRVVAGARDQQLAEMEALGMRADQVVVQSAARAKHWAFFEEAIASEQVYPCACSRKEVLAGLASAPHAEGALYTGKCRDGLSAAATEGREIGWRFKQPDPSRDFLVARTAGVQADEKSFVPAYPWACAIDDLVGEYTLLVRAWDLSHALGAQREIQKWADRSARLPAVFHATLVTANDGSRLEKRTQGVTLKEWIAAGGTAESLAKQLAASIQPGEIEPNQLRPERIWGESRESATLRELGLMLS